MRSPDTLEIKITKKIFFFCMENNKMATFTKESEDVVMNEKSYMG